MCNIIAKAEKDFYSKSVHDNKKDFKAIFNICNNLLGRNIDLPLPPSINNKMLVEEFNTFFTDKNSQDNRKSSRHKGGVQSGPECNIHQWDLQSLTRSATEELYTS